MEIQRLIEIVEYNPTSGKLYIKKSGRLLIPDDSNSVTVYDSVTKSKRKIKIDKLAWMIFHKKELPETHKIFHRNLDTNDNSIDNLWAIPKDAHKEVHDCKLNLEGALKIEVHDRDMLKYVISYRKDGILRKETIDDVDLARERFYELNKEFIKKINHYIRTV